MRLLSATREMTDEAPVPMHNRSTYVLIERDKRRD